MTPRPPRQPRPAYTAYTAVLVVLATAGFVLLPAPVHEVVTSPVYVWGCLLLVVAVPLLHSRAVRVLGHPVSETPESLLAIPLLMVGEPRLYVLTMVWVCLVTCVRLRVRAAHTTFNLAATVVGGLTSALVYQSMTGPSPAGLSPRVLLSAVTAALVCHASMELLVRVGLTTDGQADKAPTLLSAVVRTGPVLLSVGLALCSVALASTGTPLGALLGHVLLAIVISHASLLLRSTHQRWLAEQLYVASERIRGLTDRSQLPDALGAELATLWHAPGWTVTDAPSRGDESYRLDAHTYVTVRPGRALRAGLTRPAATSLVDTAVEALRALEFEEELKWRATRDTLTGLGNRHRLWAALDERLPGAALGSPLVVMSLDVDSFKAINDTYGHMVGDQLLVAVAQRLAAQSRPDDVVARMAGDEFVLVCAAEEGVGAALRRAHRIQQALAEPFTLEQSVVNVTCSMGVHYVDQRTDRNAVLTSTDAALMRAKKSGRGTVTLATEEVVLQARLLLRLDTDLRAAMHQGEFTLHYQPIVDTEEHRPVAVEALLRWERDGVIQMSPGEFVPFAEESGLISAIGLWVLRRACVQIHAWNLQHPDDRPLRVTVNISTVHIAQPTFVEDVEQILAETGMPPENLILEVTETFATLDLAEAVATGDALRRIGVSLWLDDFGTGYSSLEYLRQLPVEVVKLDRSFLTDITEDGQARDFIEAIVSLCGTIGRMPMAEGVEMAAQRQLLADIGCTTMQGYYFARPAPFDRLAAALDCSVDAAAHEGRPRTA